MTSRQRPGWPPVQRIGGSVMVLIAVLSLGVVGLLALRARPAASAVPEPVIYGALGWGDGQARPSAIYFGAGGNLFVRPIRWTSWNQSTAEGLGTRWAGSCVPSCAQGSYLRWATSLTLWRVRTHAGQRYFTRLTIRWSQHGQRHSYVFRWGKIGGGTVPGWY